MALCVVVLVVALDAGATFSQVTGRCTAPTIIGGMIQGFRAPASVLDGSVLAGRVGADRAPQLRVGQEVAVRSSSARPCSPPPRL